MRNVLLIALLAPLAACELQPGPPRPTAQSAPTPTAPTPTPTPTAPTPTAPTPTEAPPNVAPTTKKEPVVITPQCLALAEHIAGVIIASADPAQRSIFETERDRIVRSSGEVCTVQRWSDAAQRCYKAAQTQAGLKACEAKFPTQPTPPTAVRPNEPVIHGGMRPEPGAPVAPGTGSAAPTRPGAGTGSAAPTRPGAGTGSAAPVRPTPRPQAGAPARPRAGAGSAAPVPAAPGAAGSAAPRPAGGGMMPPRAGSGAR